MTKDKQSLPAYLADFRHSSGVETQMLLRGAEYGRVRTMAVLIAESLPAGLPLPGDWELAQLKRVIPAQPVLPPRILEEQLAAERALSQQLAAKVDNFERAEPGPGGECLHEFVPFRTECVKCGAPYCAPLPADPEATPLEYRANDYRQLQVKHAALRDELVQVSSLAQELHEALLHAHKGTLESWTQTIRALDGWNSFCATAAKNSKL